MTQPQNPERISVADVAAWIDQDKYFNLIDVLTPERFEAAHLPGAVNACVFNVEFPVMMAELAPDTTIPVVVYGYDGETLDAHHAAEKLLREGYGSVYMLEGGFVAWQEAGHPVEGDIAKDPDPTQAFVPKDGVYPLDHEDSSLVWAGRNKNITHSGEIRFATGEIQIDCDKVSGRFTLDMNTIFNHNLEDDDLRITLENHLKSDDFFFVSMFPTVTFTMEEATPIEDATPGQPNAVIKGMLEMRGVVRHLEAPGTLSWLDDGRLDLECHLDFDRTLWNVLYGSGKFFKYLGMHLVWDMISVEVRIAAGEKQA